MQKRSARAWFLLPLIVLGACDGSQGVLIRKLDESAGAAGAAGSAGAGGDSLFRPSPGASWQVQLVGSPDTSLPVDFYVFDLGEVEAVADELHAAGRRVACHFSAGTLEKFRPDAASFPESALGNTLPNYPDERWLDIRNPEVESLMRARLQEAKNLGCDGVQPANVAGFLADTGFAFSETEQVRYDRALAGAAHELGLSIGLPDGNRAFAETLVGDFDWAMAFDCRNEGCALATTFVAAQKAGFVAEFGDAGAAPEICAEVQALGVNAIVKQPALDSFRVPCR